MPCSAPAPPPAVPPVAADCWLWDSCPPDSEPPALPSPPLDDELPSPPEAARCATAWFSPEPPSSPLSPSSKSG
ncbi:MAG: hypothetical protein HKP03_10045 [Xanthomonadales bacterium]|nr:hypothetical protein [Xanthomonadales bacterium]